MAEAMGESAQTITNWKSRGVSQAGIVEANSRYGIPALYIRKGLGQPVGSVRVDYSESLDLGPLSSSLAAAPAPTLQEAGKIYLHNRVPVIGMAKLGENGFYEEISDIPGAGDGHLDAYSTDGAAYALRVRGDSMFPAIREGWYVVVEPNAQPVTGEYVLIKLKNGQKMVKELVLEKSDSITVMSVNGDARRTILREDIDPHYGIQAVAAILSPSKWRPD